MTGKVQPASRNQPRHRKPSSWKQPQTLLDDGLQIWQLERLLHLYRPLRFTLLHECIQFSAQLVENRYAPRKIVEDSGKRNGRRFRTCNNVAYDMVQNIVLLEVLRIFPGASEQSGYVVVFESADFVVLIFYDGNSVEFLRVLRSVFYRVRCELLDVCDANFTFGGGHGEKGEDSFVPFVVNTHDGTISGVEVNGSHNVSNVAALVEETEGFAELC